MAENLQVTARSGLNIRRFPVDTADRLAAMPNGMVVEPIDPLIWNGGWRRVRARFSANGIVEGYSSAAYLAPVHQGVSQPDTPPPPSPKPPQPDLGEVRASSPSYALRQLSPLTPVGTARRFRNELHDTFLARLEELLEKTRRRNLRFKLFEAYRQPDRQADLYNSGRNVTNADAWQSMHNYGLAADIILDVQGVGGWETGTVRGHDYMRDWLQMRDLAKQSGLHVLTRRDGRDYDFPHVELPDQKWRELQAGTFPPNGGATWAANLLRNIKAYPRGAPSELERLSQGGAALVTDAGPSDPAPEDEPRELTNPFA